MLLYGLFLVFEVKVCIHLWEAHFWLCYCSDSCLLFCPLLSIFVLSKILTSADQHSAQTTIFGKQKYSLPPTASSLHSGDRETQRSTFKQMRENASRGIYLLRDLLQTSTKDCASWNKVTCWTSKTGGTDNRSSSRTPSAYRPWVLWISTVYTKCRQAKTDRQTNRWHKQGAIPKGTETSDCHEYLILLP